MSTKNKMPIRFHKLIVGSPFHIFAEPSRGLKKSSDLTVYRKVAESYSEDVGNPDHVIILYPEDLVIPLGRGS